MNTAAIEGGPKPATSYTVIPPAGEPFLTASRCRHCGATFLGVRDHCGRCTTRDAMEPVRLSGNGRLYNYTIVYRSYPGIRVPFVSAIVDLDCGGTVKGNLIDIEADPANLQFDMPVRMVFRGAELANSEGAGYLAHFFVPA